MALFKRSPPANRIQTHQQSLHHRILRRWQNHLGSTAAIHAAGGMPQPSHDNRLQFLTREPYQGIYHPYIITKGFIENGDKLVITSKMIKSRIYLDGPTKFYALEYGDKITMSLSKKYLKIIF